MAQQNLQLLNLIRKKRERGWKPSVEELKRGFRGWHQRGYLPHFDAPNIIQFVTFQLHDSFPVIRRREWEPILKEPDHSQRRKKLEAWLDRGRGECCLKHSKIASGVEETLLGEDGRDYRLHAWVVMPNHVHVLAHVWEIPLSKLVQGWKGRSARFANKTVGMSGAFWQEDYFDMLIRDEEHLKKATRYTEQNPVKAFLAKSAHDFLWSSVRRRDEFERLPWEIQAGRK